MSTTLTFKILQPSGVLNASGGEALAAEFQECLEQRIKMVMIDLKEIQFIDSFGLGTLVSMHTRLKLAQGKLYIGGLNEQAQMLIEISDLDRVLNIVPHRNVFLKAVADA